MSTYTITGTSKDGRHGDCDSGITYGSGGYTPGSWPICQFCDTEFRGAGAEDDPFDGQYCLWTGTRSILCMGELP